MTTVGIAYNFLLAVDVKHKLIAEQEVCNHVLDMGLLTTTFEAAMGTLGVERIEAMADRGYFKIKDIEAHKEAGITAYVPKPKQPFCALMRRCLFNTPDQPTANKICPFDVSGRERLARAAPKSTLCFLSLISGGRTL